MNLILGVAESAGLTVEVYQGFLVVRGGAWHNVRLHITQDGRLATNWERTWPTDATYEGVARSRELARQCIEIRAKSPQPSRPENPMSHKPVVDHTHETLEKHFAAVKPADLHSAAEAAKAPGATVASLCPIYKAAKPLLTIVVGFPFFPAAWKAPVVALMGVFDAICP